MSSKTANGDSPVTARKTKVVDSSSYDIDRTLAQLLDHLQRYRDNDKPEIPPQIEGEYRGFEVEEGRLYFEVIAESDEKAVIKFEYRDNEGDPLSRVKLKGEKVWSERIETVLERGKQ